MQVWVGRIASAGSLLGQARARVRSESYKWTPYNTNVPVGQKCINVYAMRYRERTPKGYVSNLLGVRKRKN